MQTGVVRHTAICHERVKRVAVCGGAGSFWLGLRKIGAQVFISADF